MKTFYYSEQNQAIEDKMEGHGIYSKIRHIDNLALSMSMDIDGTMDAIKKIITQRKNIAKMAYMTENPIQKEQLHCVLDYTNDDLRKLLAL